MNSNRFQLVLLNVFLGLSFVSLDLNESWGQSTTTPNGGNSGTSRPKVQNFATIAQLPSVGSNQPVPGFVPRNLSQSLNQSAQTNQGLRVAGSLSSVSNATSYSGSNQSAGGMVETRYLYPGGGSTNSVYQQTGSTIGNSNSAAQPQWQNRVAQNCPTCVGGTNYGVNYAAAPSPSYQTPIAGTVPQLNIQMPNQVAPQPTYTPPAYNPPAYATPAFGTPNYTSPSTTPNYNYQQPNYGYQSPTIGTPQYRAAGANWWTPFVSGSGVYQPVIQSRKMPPGTYLGQGLIGQPTAYVDGQPVRNLLRYISP